jgi:hypothetical protein
MANAAREGRDRKPLRRQADRSLSCAPEAGDQDFGVQAL